MGMKKDKIKDSGVEVSASLLSVEIKNLLASYDDLNNKSKESIESNYKVSQVLGSVAFLYERVRNMLDYKGDHLLRRNAIERILKRQIWEKKTENLQKTAENLIKELIWARYIKNDSVPKEKISELFSILQKYMKLFSLLEMKFKEKRREEIQNWFVGVLSSEVEENLDPR